MTATTRLPLLLIALQLLASRCAAGCTPVRVVVKTDGHPGDSSWQLKRKRNVVWTEEYKNKRAHTEYATEKCLGTGKYEFKMMDRPWGDGICCRHGEGYYKLEAKHDGKWHTLLQGGKFKNVERSIVFIGSKHGNKWKNQMTQREKEYLEAHNVRRKRYHTKWGKEEDYVPLKWSPKLQRLAQIYADISIEECKQGIPARHGDKSNVYGENVLGNSGRTGSKWAEYKSADGYLHQFVEREEGWPYPRNGHESTVVWRATQYVGCADATIRWTADNGADRTCHRVVCRYARPGNCRGREPTFDWEKEAARDHTWCGPICPPEGCFHADP